MSTLGRPDDLKLHLPATSGHHVQIEYGNYDFAWYPNWGLGIAFLGHHVVAIWSAERDALTVGAEIAHDFRRWAQREAELSDGERIFLTERGCAEDVTAESFAVSDGTVDRV